MNKVIKYILCRKCRKSTLYAQLLLIRRFVDVIYRAPLESILDRKYYKAYPHVAKYLRKLDTLALEIDDWQDLGEHGMYHVWLNQVHGKRVASGNTTVVSKNTDSFKKSEQTHFRANQK